MALWISLPLPDEERGWLEAIGGPWRESKDLLWRRSGAEVALVIHEVWRRWQLPEPPAPIITLEVNRLDVTKLACDGGALWERPFGRQPWGAQAGMLRFPSGLLVEVVLMESRPERTGN